MRYVSFDDVCTIHDEMMQVLGEPRRHVAHPDRLHSALERPRTAAYYEGVDFIGQAARLLVGIARAHAFVDGNKRTSYATLLVCVRLNGYELVGERSETGPCIVRFASSLGVPIAEADSEMDRYLRPRVLYRPGLTLTGG